LHAAPLVNESRNAFGMTEPGGMSGLLQDRPQSLTDADDASDKALRSLCASEHLVSENEQRITQ